MVRIPMISRPHMLIVHRETMLAVHGTAPFRLVRTAAPYFRVKDGEPRCIINISSTSGTHGNAGQANYSMGKAGVVGLAKVSHLLIRLWPINVRWYRKPETGLPLVQTQNHGRFLLHSC